MLPQSYESLLTLPGIGPYTAAAVASIAFGQPSACVDGNIRRVMARQQKKLEPTNRQVQSWADQHLVHQRAGDWNQALMELGATVCTPQKPQCQHCPIESSCQGREGPTAYPKAKKTKVKEVTLWTCVEFDIRGNPIVHQRDKDGLFGGLWGPQINEGDVPEAMHEQGVRWAYFLTWEGAEQGPRSVPRQRLSDAYRAPVTITLDEWLGSTPPNKAE